MWNPKKIIVINIPLSFNSEPDIGITVDKLASDDDIREALSMYLGELISNDLLPYYTIKEK